MNSLYLLIPIALIFTGVAIWLLIWSVNNGQYDDLDRDAWRALHDELDSDTAKQSRSNKKPHDID